jgi:hypothetical protein
MDIDSEEGIPAIMGINRVIIDILRRLLWDRSFTRALGCMIFCCLPWTMPVFDIVKASSSSTICGKGHLSRVRVLSVPRQQFPQAISGEVQPKPSWRGSISAARKPHSGQASGSLSGGELMDRKA